MTGKFYDLTYAKQPDGTIRLTQTDCGEDYIVDLHPAQLRHIAEAFGLVAPDYPADELTKRLARQLCTIQKELVDECHRSPWLELTYAKLDAWCSALPDDIFPYDLWDEEPQALPDGHNEALGRESLPADTNNPSPTPYIPPVGAQNGELFATNQLQGE